MGQRANAEETYSGESLTGTYLAGVYYPDKTRVGWWKNGYPEYFAKVLNSPRWSALEVEVNGHTLDLAKTKPTNFRRELDMQHGLLTREFEVSCGNVMLQIRSLRICHMEFKELGLLSYAIQVLEGEGTIDIRSLVDGDVTNEDSNYGERFWHQYSSSASEEFATLSCQTKKTAFEAHYTVTTDCTQNAVPLTGAPLTEDMKAGHRFLTTVRTGDQILIEKRCIVLTSFAHPHEKLPALAKLRLAALQRFEFDLLCEEHCQNWQRKWKESDIEIQGDIAAQQGIRFNVFQLHQTYHGLDPRLNIGPKGFTGEKYGGSTYWDTEAYCLPFYLATAAPEVALNLLTYRYRHLEKAIENAVKLGIDHGAALYPMVTMNGEECHNEWEITFEEIHRNGAIAYAIYDYTRWTGDSSYRDEKGIFVLIAISRFWAQRVHFSSRREAYVMHGVTGPNEYENNVNNNWYTNYIAAWCLRYTIKTLEKLQLGAPKHYQTVLKQTALKPGEVALWQDIMDKIVLPTDPALGIFVQHDGFLEKELIPASTLPAEETPLHEHWSWDRILRSCYIKQADVLQGLYFFEEQFTPQQISSNFGFYEPLTVHESSLSPCVHAVLACSINRMDKAYEMYLRTARLDLDDYNNDTRDGLHITSMAGTWLSIIKGFAGLRIRNDILSLRPRCPQQWHGFAFAIRFRNNMMYFRIDAEKIEIKNDGPPLQVEIDEQTLKLEKSVTYALVP